MRIVILINFGTEIRPFFENYLNKMLPDKAEYIYFIKDSSIKNSLNEKLKSNSLFYDVKLVNGSNTFIKRLFYKFDSYFKNQRQSRQRRMKIGNYHFTTGLNNMNKKWDKILGSELLYGFMKGIYNLLSKHFFYSEYVSTLYKTHGITDLLYYGSNMYEIRYFIQTAKQDNIKLWHYIGNWKDIYIDDFIPVKPEKIFVWSEILKNDLLLFNKHIKKSHVEVCGNLFFHHFKDYKPFHDFIYYQNKYRLISEVFYLWPLSMKVVFPNEHLLLDKIDEFIESTFEENKPIILVRDNPFGAAVDHSDFYNKLKNVRLADNYWLVSKNDDFTFQTSEGEKEWADLLYYSKAIISTPSTVTLESILFRKDSINILFDENGLYSHKIAAFANAPFYKELLQRKDIVLCNTFDEFITNLLIENQKPEKLTNSEIDYPAIISGNKDADIPTFAKMITS